VDRHPHHVRAPMGRRPMRLWLFGIDLVDAEEPRESREEHSPGREALSPCLTTTDYERWQPFERIRVYSGRRGRRGEG
jgi:hypothetical protein